MQRVQRKMRPLATPKLRPFVAAAALSAAVGAVFWLPSMQPARDAYRACLNLAAKHLGARIAITHVERKLGRIREAIKEGMIAVDQAPHDGDAMYAVGLAYAARGDNPAARRYLEAFLHAKPELETRLEVEALLATMIE